MASQVGLKSFRVTIPVGGTVGITADRDDPTKNIYTPFVELHNLTSQSDMYVGGSDVDSNAIPLGTGATKSYSANQSSGMTDGDFFNLKEWYVSGTAGDVLVIQYLQTSRQDMAQGDGLLEGGVIKQGGANSPGWMNNIGLAAATTSSSNDSIKITSANGSALSPINVGYVTLPSTTSGLLTTLRITADVTIDLTGAHWGEGGKGDLTDYLLSVYAINDAGTLKWGVASVPGHSIILGSDDSATATDINLIDEVLVNSALTGDSSCLEVGWFKANFDDTGGTSEDLWSVQASAGDINLGPRPELEQYFTPTLTHTTNTATSGYWLRRGNIWDINVFWDYSGAPNSATLSFTMPTGLTINYRATSGLRDHLGNGIFRSDATPVFVTSINCASTSTASIFYHAVSGTDVIIAGITETTPQTIDTNGYGSFVAKIPIAEWD